MFIDPYSQILGQFIVSVKPGRRCVSLQSLVLNNLWIDVTDENELVGIYIQLANFIATLEENI